MTSATGEKNPPQWPDIRWPDLPVVAQREKIADAIARHQVVVLCGETGSGKTTQLPKICLDLGRGQGGHTAGHRTGRGIIGHTQPRRLAARTVAERIAEELQTPLGQVVGYKIRFTDQTRRDTTRIKLMTDGVLLAETRTDRDLRAYDTLILDEAHERSLNIDFLLGYLKRLLPRRRDLKLILTSATIDPERFSRHFNNAPIITVPGRTYPVETRYFPLMVDEREVDVPDAEPTSSGISSPSPLAGEGGVGGSSRIESLSTIEESLPPPPPARGGGEEQPRRARPKDRRLTEIARTLRRDSTVPERFLWAKLRDLPNGPKFRRQQPVGRYIADFYCPSARLVVELDGRTHDEFSADADAERQAWMESQGLRVVRFTNDDVLQHLTGVVETILREVASSPPPPAGGGGGKGSAVERLPRNPEPLPLPPPARGGGKEMPDAGLPDADLTELEGVLEAARGLINEGHGDILAFLPTERDIRETAEALVAANLNADVLPLFGRLSHADQLKVFRPDGKRRRIVLATNVAETSVTVPGIHCVIDTGLARISRYSSRTKVQRLPIEAVPRASADQRKGRCGRVGPGICVRLYSEKDFEARPEFAEPEILRTNLASVILQMKWLKLGPIEDFPFVDPPDARQVRDGLQTLHEIGAIDDREELTPIGLRLARLPVDVRVGRMIVGGQDEDCVEDVLVIAAALSTQDVKERPSDQQDAADQSHAKYKDTQSDFISMLRLWRSLRQKQAEVGSSAFRKYCRANFISYIRFREWSDVHAQLRDLSATDVGGRPVRRSKQDRDRSQAIRPIASIEADDFPQPRRDAIHRALLGGLLGNIAFKADQTGYTGARGTKLTLWPGSTLSKGRPPWLMSAELVETTRLYARTVAPVKPEWIERAARHLVKRSYTDPHYVKQTAHVHAFEKVSLYGLILVPRRSVHFGPIDSVQSRQLFIQHALVLGEFGTDHPSILANRRRTTEVERWQEKLRRRDLLSDQATRFAFFDAIVPPRVYSGPTFEEWAKRGRGSGSHELEFSDDVLLRAGVVDDLLPPPPLRGRAGVGGSSDGDRFPPAKNPSPHPLPQGEGEKIVAVREHLAAAFPDTLPIAGAKLPLEYKFEPGEDDDGVTLIVPMTLLPQVRDERAEWLVPGWVLPKIDALIRALPKRLRTLFVPVNESAATVAGKLGPFGVGSFEEAVAGVLWKLRGEPVTRADFQADHLPPNLRLNVRVIDAGGNTLTEGRDLAELRAKLNQQVAESFTSLADPRFTRDDLQRWDVGDLPPRVEIEQHGIRLYGYPALVETGEKVSLRLLDSQQTADRMMPSGLRRLFMTETARELKQTLRDLPDLESLRLNYRPFGTGEELISDLTLVTADRAFFAGGEGAKGSIMGGIRTQTEFAARAGRAWGRLHETSRALGRQLSDILTRHRTLTTLLHRDFAPLLVDSVDDMRQQLARLLPKRFLSALPGERLEHLPRYLKAIDVRMTKLMNAGLSRDLTGMTTLRPLQRQYDDAVRAHARRGVVDPALDDYRWLLEELRISLFAQDVKTSVPVSPRKLDEAWKLVRVYS